MRGFLVFAGVLLTAPAFGESPPEVRSFAKPTPGGKYVLVMLEKRAGWEKETEKTALEQKYARSGLYPKDDPTKPLWPCEWHANWAWNVFASDDGIYAVRVPDTRDVSRYFNWMLRKYDKPISPKRAGWENEPALLISKNGQLFRTLAFKDVFVCSRFTDRDCSMGPIVTIDGFLDDAGHVSISTRANGNKQTATIAFRTGEVVRPTGSEESAAANGWSWDRVIVIGFVVVGLGTAAFALAILLLRKQNLTPQPPSLRGKGEQEC